MKIGYRYYQFGAGLERENSPPELSSLPTTRKSKFASTKIEQSKGVYESQKVRLVVVGTAAVGTIQVLTDL